MQVRHQFAQKLEALLNVAQLDRNAGDVAAGARERGNEACTQGWETQSIRIGIVVVLVFASIVACVPTATMSSMSPRETSSAA